MISSVVLSTGVHSYPELIQINSNWLRRIYLILTDHSKPMGIICTYILCRYTYERNPEFTITMTKDSQSVGYYEGDNIVFENLRIDIQPNSKFFNFFRLILDIFNI